MDKTHTIVKDVIRKYLEHMSVSRYELMRSYRNDNKFPASDPTLPDDPAFIALRAFNDNALAAEEDFGRSLIETKRDRAAHEPWSAARAPVR